MKKRFNYFSKYDNETRTFIISLEDGKTLQEIADKLNITYSCLHYAFKINRITQDLFVKVLKAYPLTLEKKQELKELVARS